MHDAQRSPLVVAGLVHAIECVEKLVHDEQRGCYRDLRASCDAAFQQLAERDPFDVLERHYRLPAQHCGNRGARRYSDGRARPACAPRRKTFRRSESFWRIRVGCASAQASWRPLVWWAMPSRPRPFRRCRAADRASSFRRRSRVSTPGRRLSGARAGRRPRMNQSAGPPAGRRPRRVRSRALRRATAEWAAHAARRAKSVVARRTPAIAERRIARARNTVRRLDGPERCGLQGHAKPAWTRTSEQLGERSGQQADEPPIPIHHGCTPRAGAFQQLRRLRDGHPLIEADAHRRHDLAERTFGTSSCAGSRLEVFIVVSRQIAPGDSNPDMGDRFFIELLNQVGTRDHAEGPPIVIDDEEQRPSPLDQQQPPSFRAANRRWPRREMAS